MKTLELYTIFYFCIKTFIGVRKIELFNQWVVEWRRRGMVYHRTGRFQMPCVGDRPGDRAINPDINQTDLIEPTVLLTQPETTR